MHYQWWIVFRVNTIYTLNTIIGFISPIAIHTSLLNTKKASRSFAIMSGIDLEYRNDKTKNFGVTFLWSKCFKKSATGGFCLHNASRRVVDDLKPTAFSDGANNNLFNIENKMRPSTRNHVRYWSLTRKLYTMHTS